MGLNPVWGAEVSTKNKNMDGLNDSLKSIEALPLEQKNQAIAGLVQTAMMQQWVQGVHVLLNVPGVQFPTESVRDGLDSFVAPSRPELTEQLLRVLSYHTDKIAPSLKAEIGMEFGAYLSEQQWKQHRKSGLISGVDNEKTVFRMHGATLASGSSAPARIAELIAEMPKTVRAHIYNRQLTAGITKVEREVGHFHPAFMAAVVKDNVLFDNTLTTEKKFVISPKHLSHEGFFQAAQKRDLLSAEHIALRENLPAFKPPVATSTLCYGGPRVTF